MYRLLARIAIFMLRFALMFIFRLRYVSCRATFIHYVLHFPAFYQIHRRHHRNPNNIVASAAWEDSWCEYALMELPSFGIAILLFPTHFPIHMFHFILHGYDGAANHSGFSPPGFLGYLFDGEYHYYHHSILTCNYAEIEFLDRLFGTHHSQRRKAL